MKKYKLIFGLWLCAIVIIVSILGVLAYNNAREGEIVLKELAVTTLREVAEQVVNQEFEELGVPYVEWKNKQKHTKRIAITAGGRYEISIDSLKEKQSLYSLETVGYKIEILNDSNKMPLEKIFSNWQIKMKEKDSGVTCSFCLDIKPLGSNRNQVFTLGDTAICVSNNMLATYYLDEMYTMMLTVYMLPAFVSCIDWTDRGLLATFCLSLILFLAFPIGIGVKRYQGRNVTEVCTSNIFQFGEYSFDAVQHTLLYKGQETECTPQSAKLLIAFTKASDYILSNDEIAAVCGWALDDNGIDQRRRKAIALLRKLFSADDSVRIVALDNKRGYQMVISQ